MAVTLLRHIIDDISKDLKQTHDDLVITDTQVGYWVLMIGNRLKSQHIGKRSSGAFLSTFAGIPVQVFEDNTNPNQTKNRKHIVLPKSIYDYHEDRGIDFIAYYAPDDKPSDRPRFTKNTFTRTTPSAAERLYMGDYEEPTPENPYFYRVHEYIYFLGIECVDVEEVEIGIYATFDPITDIDIDEPFDFPEELIAILKRQVIDLGRFALLVPQEKINEGASQVGPDVVPTNKIVSVNQLDEDQVTNE